MIRRFLRSRQGTTSIEYAVIGCLISIVIVASAASIGTKVNDMFRGVVSRFP